MDEHGREELLGAHFAGELDERGAARLEELLSADPQLARRFERLVFVEGLLRTRGTSPGTRKKLVARVLRSVPDEPSRRKFTRHVLAALPQRRGRSRLHRPARWPASVYVGTSVAVAVAVLLVYGIYLYIFEGAAGRQEVARASDAAPIGRIGKIEGSVMYAAARTGCWVPAAEGAALHPGDALDTREGMVRVDLGRATVCANRSTRLRIVAAESEHGEVPLVWLAEGEVYITDAGGRVHVETDDGLVSPVGTRFDVMRTSSATVVLVEQGIVQTRARVGRTATATRKGASSKVRKISLLRLLGLSVPVQVEAGRQSRMRRGAMPSAPVKVNVARAVAWSKRIRADQPVASPTPTGPAAPAPPGTWPIEVDLDTGERIGFTLLDGTERTVTLKATRLDFADQGATVWSTATVEVAAGGLPPQSAEVPAAYLHAPVVLNGVRVYVKITREFNDGRLRDGGGTSKAAKLLLSDARYTLTDVAQYRWPFPNLLWQEAAYTSYWQGLHHRGSSGKSLLHYGGLLIGTPKRSPFHAWAGGVVKTTQRKLDWYVTLNPADDGRPYWKHTAWGLDTVETAVQGKRVKPGDRLGLSSGIFFSADYEWAPVLAEWYLAHADAVRRSYIKDWLIIGPYENPDAATRITKDYLGNEAGVWPQPGLPAPGAQRWRRWDNLVPGVIYVGEAASPYPNSGWAWANGNYPHGAAYLATYLYSAHARSVVLNIGTSDAVKVWLGRSAVFEERNYVSDATPGSPKGRTIIVDQHKVPVRLRAGWNRLLVKAAQVTGGPQAWQLSVRVSDRAGQPVPGLRISPVGGGGKP